MTDEMAENEDQRSVEAKLEAKKKKLNLQLEKVNKRVDSISTQIRVLYAEQDKYVKKRDELVEQLKILTSDYKTTDVPALAQVKHPWTNTIETLLKDKFHMEEFRVAQLAAINLTLSKKDVLLIMPTGGGKSLVFQMATMVENYLTLVISPLLSLIEDQIMHLEKYDIKAASVNGNVPTVMRNTIQKSILCNQNNAAKILYVTPEWLAKSKTFMAFLQKCHENEIFGRIVIDEVHCCSTWGHDFRTDYNYLSLMRGIFPGVPILGLTATANKATIRDITEILNIPKVVVIVDKFNRPNLYYEIKKKVSKEHVVKELKTLMKRDFKDMSGIIYATTIKDCEEITKLLRDANLKVREYHAQLTPNQKQNVQHKWYSGHYQAVVATIAFGMGIDKPDVRFVIHTSAPKSLEAYYQESGRAGRDGARATCIIFYNLNDVLKNLAMSTSKREEDRNYSSVEYCLNMTKCRREVISNHFDDTFSPDYCDKMCDICNKTEKVRYFNITSAVKVLHDILRHCKDQSENMTLVKLLTAWFRKGPKNLRSKHPLPGITESEAEDIIFYLLKEQYLKIVKGFSMYTVIAYIGIGREVKNESILMPYYTLLIGFTECLVIEEPSDKADNDVSSPPEEGTS